MNVTSCCSESLTFQLYRLFQSGQTAEQICQKTGLPLNTVLWRIKAAKQYILEHTLAPTRVFLSSFFKQGWPLNLYLSRLNEKKMI